MLCPIYHHHLNRSTKSIIILWFIHVYDTCRWGDCSKSTNMDPKVTPFCLEWEDDYLLLYFGIAISSSFYLSHFSRLRRNLWEFSIPVQKDSHIDLLRSTKYCIEASFVVVSFYGARHCLCFDLFFIRRRRRRRQFLLFDTNNDEILRLRHPLDACLDACSRFGW